MGYLFVKNEKTFNITVSVVSHGQADLINNILVNLRKCENLSKIVVTLNLPGEEVIVPKALINKVELIQNDVPAGFGTNHNKAFERCATQYFAVLNPDISFEACPFSQLVKEMENLDCGLIGPLVKDLDSNIEDSARHFPTPLSLVKKFFLNDRGMYNFKSTESKQVDFLAGMFMLFKSDIYSKIDGFDEKFYMYYEDVDICWRLWMLKQKVIFYPQAHIFHDARRQSHRSYRYAFWHMQSMARFFWKKWSGKLT